MNTNDSTRSDPAAPMRGAPPRSRRGRSLWVPALVGVATVGLIGWAAWPTLRPVTTVSVVQAAFAAQAPAPAATEPTDPDPATPHTGADKTVQAPGWLEAEPFYIACTSLIDGVVSRIDVLEGEPVEAGQVVAQLVDDDARLAVRSAEAAVASARAALDIARAELAAATTDWQQPVEVERAVEAGRAMVARNRAELAQLPALIDAARAKARRFEEEHRRLKGLGPSGSVSELEVIVAREQAAEAAAMVASLEAQRPVLAAKLASADAELKAAQRNLELRTDDRRRLDAARAAVAMAEATVASALAARDDAALQLERTVIRSPITGYVSRRLKVPGDKVMLGMDEAHSAHLVHVYDPNRLQVRVDVPLADVAHVRAGQRCEVVVEVLPDQTFVGEVLRVTHLADLQKNTLEVKVKVIDPSPLLRPDMLTRVKFLADNQANKNAAGRAGQAQATTVRVPADAIDGRTGSDRIWRVADRRGDRGVVQPAAVERIASTGDWASVTGPIRPGDLLVVDFDRIKQGQRVRFTALTERGAD